MLYFCGIDPSQGGIRRNQGTPGQSNECDDFAVATWRIDDNFEYPAELVHMFRSNSLSSRQMSAVVHKLDAAFNYALIMMDPSGGGYAMRDNLREPEQDTGAEKFQVVPIITNEDSQMSGIGRNKLCFFSRGSTRLKESGLIMASEGALPNKMHELFKIALESQPQMVRFPEPWTGWQNKNFVSSDAMRDHIIENKLQGRDKASAEIDLALSQLTGIEKELNKENKPVVDSQGFFSFKSYCRKDCAYAMLYGYFAIWLWKEENAIRTRRAPRNTNFVFSLSTV